ncbi:MAG: BamA/TamA family outer membrane protein [Chitinophagaceae bacterium]
MKLFLFCCLIALIPVSDCMAQKANDSITSVGSPFFKINGGRTFWMGANYRKEWRTPIKVPILNLNTEKGGLKPVKRGGGKQTRSLRVEDPKGRQYSLRSIQKFITSKTLPADLQSEAAEDLVADGISASYPYAALSIPVLAEAAGVPYLKVKVVYIPDDPKLGEFRKDFGNLLAYFEERLPESVDKGYNTDEVADKLKDDNDNSVDQMALLRARILDMFVMDLDRHEDQWEWGATDKEKGKQYYPIPKDRDQAFYTNQGVIPHIVQWPWLVPQLEGFKAKARSIKRFNFAARNLDRFFLNGLTEKDWQTAVDQFLPKMTDAVIEKAMAQQPPEVRHLSTNKLASTLKERRKYFAAEVMEYYRFLSEKVNVTASDKNELFDITRNDDGSILLKVQKISKEGDLSAKLYERNFDPKDTKEIVLYGFGGEDKFEVKGNNDKIKIRMIGGDGVDQFENKGTSGNGGNIYDLKKEDNKVIGRFKNKMSNDTMANYYQRIYYKYNQVIPFLSAGFNPDDGLYLGGYLKIIRHGFRKSPYKNSHTFAFNKSLTTDAFNVRLNSEFIGVFGRKSDLVLGANINAPVLTNFFGFGTNTIYDKTQTGKFRYYRVRYDLADLSIELRKNFSEKVIMTIGPVAQFYKLDPNDEFNQKRNIIQNVPPGLNTTTFIQGQSYVGGRFHLTADTRNNKVIPQRGILWESNVRYLSGVNNTNYEVTQVNSEFTFHIPIIKKVMVFSNRFGGGHNFGDFEFYQAQYLGSDDNLRGYRKNRFAGRSKAYNNAELRIALANFKTYLFPGALGILGFYDTGRVWADNDNTNKWLSGYGGGFWISPLKRMVLTATYAMSEEDKIILIGLGWRF